MNISICITIFNEGDNLEVLLDSLLCQSKKPDEIIIVDGGSTDSTLKILKQYSKKYKLINSVFRKCTRAEGRNIGIKLTKNEIIAMTDAGCVAHRDWLEKITQPFKQSHPRGVHSATSGESFGVDIVAGFYKMVGKNPMQKAMAVFLGVMPKDFNNDFLPSTRSMAFTKSAWKALGGFPESKENSAEDTDFNYKALNFGLKYARIKNAIVEWGMPTSIYNFQLKIYNYAKWDAQRGIWWHPTQRLASHNIKALSVLLRYLIGLVIFWIFGYWYLLVFIGIYFYWAFRKAGFWGPVLQIASDFAVMIGFISGIIEK